MDIERTTSSPRSNRTKSASEKKSKWQEILGYEQDQQTAKLMFRNSVNTHFILRNFFHLLQKQKITMKDYIEKPSKNRS